MIITIIARIMQQIRNLLLRRSICFVVSTVFFFSPVYSLRLQAVNSHGTLPLEENIPFIISMFKPSRQDLSSVGICYKAHREFLQCLCYFLVSKRSSVSDWFDRELVKRQTDNAIAICYLNFFSVRVFRCGCVKLQRSVLIFKQKDAERAMKEYVEVCL